MPASDEVKENLRRLRLPPAPVVNEATRNLWQAQGLFKCPTRLMLDFPGLKQVPEGYLPTEEDIKKAHEWFASNGLYIAGG